MDRAVERPRSRLWLWAVVLFAAGLACRWVLAPDPRSEYPYSAQLQLGCYGLGLVYLGWWLVAAPRHLGRDVAGGLVLLALVAATGWLVRTSLPG